MSDVWIVIAYTQPPRRWGFKASASGKSWWREIKGKSWALQLGKALAEIDIHGVIRRKKEPSRPKAKKSAPPGKAKFVKPRASRLQGGFGGKLNAAPIKGTWRRKVRRA